MVCVAIAFCLAAVIGAGSARSPVILRGAIARGPRLPCAVVAWCVPCPAREIAARN